MIANCRNGHFLQIPIARKTLQFLKKNYIISRDRELQKRVTFYKSRSQEILYNFSKTIQFLVISNCRKESLSANHDRKKYSTISQETIQFLVIANCRNGPLSGNHDLKKNYAVFLENYTVSRDPSFQKLTGRIASDSLEKS